MTASSESLPSTDQGEGHSPSSPEDPLSEPSRDPIRSLVGWLPRLLPKGGGRLVSTLAPLYKHHTHAMMLVGNVPFQLDLSIDMERHMWYGVYERAMLGLFTRYLRPGDTVLDCGANIGWVSGQMLARVGPSGRVLSFEPHPSHVTRLCQFSARAHERGLHMEVLPFALGAKPGHVTLHMGKDNHGFNTIVSEITRSELTPASVQVELRPLDQVLAERAINKIRFAKVDVEGSELGLLQGARVTLERRAIDYLYVEISTKAGRLVGDGRDAVARFLSGLGYRGQLIHKGKLLPLPSGPEIWQNWIVESMWSAPDVSLNP